MNYFFFLDHPDKDLKSSVEICNYEPISNFYNKPQDKKNIYIFYIESGSWKNEIIEEIDYGDRKIIEKNDLPNFLKNKNIFISLSSRKIKSNHSPIIDNSLDSTPAWRSNIKIFNNNSSCSYQGELPSFLLNKKLSLVSCSPFLQLDNDNFQNYFYLVNMYKEPIIEKFSVDILDSNKNILKQLTCYTNTINCHDLTFLKEFNHKNKMFVFRSQSYGGIPIYFSKSSDNSQMSLEHTHPPTEYLFSGNRMFFQKRKKSHWFE